MRFGIEGTEYVLDLSEDNAQEFHRLLEPYVNVARKTTATYTPRRESVSAGDDSRAIRQWAQDQGSRPRQDPTRGYRGLQQSAFLTLRLQLYLGFLNISLMTDMFNRPQEAPQFHGCYNLFREVMLA